MFLMRFTERAYTNYTEEDVMMAPLPTKIPCGVWSLSDRKLCLQYERLARNLS